MTQRYEPTPTGQPQAFGPGTARPDIEMNAAVITPVDRLRWAAVLGGLFVALSTFLVLTLLGAAIGLSAYDPGDPMRNFGIGASIWSVIAVLLSFFIGGWFAARAAAVRGHSNGLINGAMVWAVAIPLLFISVASLVGSQAARDDGVIAASVRPDDVTQVTRTGRSAAWWTLASVLLALGASALGGYAGARSYMGPRDRDIVGGDRITTTPPPPRTAP